MFQFPGFASAFSADAGVASGGLPHSDIRASRDICSLARLFAACHVLLRLREPRHPSCALLSFPLTILRRKLLSPRLRPQAPSLPLIAAARVLVALLVSFLLSFLFLLVVDFSFQLSFHHVNVLSFFELERAVSLRTHPICSGSSPWQS